MKYPRHKHACRAILLQEPRDRDLTDEELYGLQAIQDSQYLSALHNPHHNNLTDKVIVSPDNLGIPPA